jgi:hypothetical protein
LSSNGRRPPSVAWFRATSSSWFFAECSNCSAANRRRIRFAGRRGRSPSRSPSRVAPSPAAGASRCRQCALRGDVGP